MSESPSPHPRHSSILRLGRPLAATGIFFAGAAAAAAFSTATPAKAEDCIPPLGCLPPLPSLPLPTVSLPTTTAAGDTGSAPPPSTTTTATDNRTSAGAAAATRLAAASSALVRGQGKGRTIEITLTLTNDARVTAVLSRAGRTLAQRVFVGHAGRNRLLLRVGGTAKPGPARLALSSRSASGEIVRATHQLRLPR
jgi:hypothetical protein